MIIVDRIDNQFVYTVVDQHKQNILETSDRSQAVKRDQEVNPTARSEFVAKVNWDRNQLDV
jgi:hypothetical protein